MLRDATDHRLAVVVRGNATKAHWGPPPHRADIVLSTTNLREPLDHCAGDLTVTASAGTTLEEINAALSREGQWLALDPWAGGRSTVGGLLATNDSGPRRHRYGAPRDLVIGIEFTMADGTHAKGGGRVVKNVAGYDMGRLLCGSFGALALITSATFKLSPRPAASRTVAIDELSYAALAEILKSLAKSSLTPSAVEVAAPGPRLLVRFETTDSAAARQAADVFTLAAGYHARAVLLEGGAEHDAWAAHEASTHSAGALVRANVLPSEVASTLASLETCDQQKSVRVHVAGRALLGTLMIRVDGDTHAIAQWISELRRLVRASSGSVAVLDASPDLRGEVAVWDELGAAATLMRAIKTQFDPHQTLCPGGGPAGLA